jgi:DNA-binding NarL/FixJ family response regulator
MVINRYFKFFPVRRSLKAYPWGREKNAYQDMKILIADDQLLFRDGVCRILTEWRADVCILEAEALDEALTVLAGHSDIDIILLDLMTPGMEGFLGLHAISKTAPQARIVILSALDDTEHIRRAAKLGAVGYVSKTEKSQVLVKALQLVLAGESYLPVGVLEGAEEATESVGAKGEVLNFRRLTLRQLDVLRALINGQSNKDIARSLKLSEGTVKLHVGSILRLLGARNRTEAAAKARALRLWSAGVNQAY